MKLVKTKLNLLFFIIASLFFLQNADCQNDKNFKFTGTLQLSSHEIITYNIQFADLGNGEIEGKSITDLFGEDRTVCKIKGTIDWKKQRISFSESYNLSTKSTMDANTFCFLVVNNAQIIEKNGKSVIMGEFTGKYMNDEKCASGKLFLVGAEYLNVISKKILTNEIIKNEDSLKMMQQLNENYQAKIGNTYLQSNDVFRLKWNSPEIIIEISEAGKLDNDEIAIYINEKKVLDRLVISKDKKTLVFPFTENKGSIRIEALSEGVLKNCTANITLRDQDNPTSLVTIMKKNTNIVILLNKINKQIE